MIRMTHQNRPHAAGPEQEAAPRSGLGSVPGAEFPTSVYVIVIAAFAWIVVASWMAFGSEDSHLELAMASVLTLVFFALPIILRRVASARLPADRAPRGDFMPSRVEIATGPMKGSEALLQVLLIPLALAFAATAIGIVFLFMT